MFVDTIEILSKCAIPMTLALIPLWAIYKKIDIYDTFVDGAKEGFSVGVKIIPYLVGILVAIGMFRASGAIDIIAMGLGPFLNFIGMPADILPLAIIRPLSGSGALGIMTEIAGKYGGDSYMAKLAAVMTGSSETTFYVLAVYFGAVGIKKVRHALIAGLIADFAGIMSALIICRIIFQ
jgi:spore maturation protein B